MCYFLMFSLPHPFSPSLDYHLLKRIRKLWVRLRNNDKEMDEGVKISKSYIFCIIFVNPKPAFIFYLIYNCLNQIESIVVCIEFAIALHSPSFPVSFGFFLQNPGAGGGGDASPFAPMSTPYTLININPSPSIENKNKQ